MKMKSIFLIGALLMTGVAGAAECRKSGSNFMKALMLYARDIEAKSSDPKYKPNSPTDNFFHLLEKYEILNEFLNDHKDAYANLYTSKKFNAEGLGDFVQCIYDISRDKNTNPEFRVTYRTLDVGTGEVPDLDPVVEQQPALVSAPPVLALPPSLDIQKAPEIKAEIKPEIQAPPVQVSPVSFGTYDWSITGLTDPGQIESAKRATTAMESILEKAKLLKPEKQNEFLPAVEKAKIAWEEAKKKKIPAFMIANLTATKGALQEAATKVGIQV